MKFQDSLLFEMNYLNSNLDFIKNLNLKPIVKLNIDHMINTKGKINELGDIDDFLRPRLDFIVNRLGSQYLSNWSFEISSRDYSLYGEFKYIRAISNLIKEYSGQIKIGLNLQQNLESKDSKGDILRKCREEEIDLDFVSFESDPNKSGFIKGSDNINGYRLGEYLKKQVEEIKFLLNKNHFYDSLIFITSFNTLGGSGFELAGSFFRAALILNTIASVNMPYVSLSFWLSNETYENINIENKSDYRILSLFLIDLVKRPVYFILNFIDKTNRKLITINDYIYISKNNDSYYLIASNPYYYNPLYSVIENYTSLNRKNINITMNGIEVGKYLIKSFVLDEDSGGDFDLLLGTINYNFMDQEILSYVIDKNSPNMKVFQKEIDDEYNIRLSIGSNVVILYEIKKIS